MEDFKCFSDLAEDNPAGLEALPTPNTFSSNPGFMAPLSTARMGHATRPQQTVVGSGQTMGRSASRGFGSINPATPGSVDPGMDGGPQTVTSGFGG